MDDPELGADRFEVGVAEVLKPGVVDVATLSAVLAVELFDHEMRAETMPGGHCVS